MYETKQIRDLFEYKKRLELTLSGTNCGTWSHDFENDEIYYDKRAQQLLGISKSPLPMSEWLKLIHPEDKRSVFDTIQSGLDRNERHINVTYRLIVNEEIRHIKVDSYIEYKDGKTKTSYGIIQDITQQKQLEEEMELAKRQVEETNKKLKSYAHIVDKYVITSSTDKNGIITAVSDAFCAISGYSREELVGSSHNVVRHPNTPASFYEELWRAVGSGRAWKGEIRNRRKDGSDYWVYMNIDPVLDERGTIAGYTAVAQDISDKKRIERLSITDPLTQIYNRLKLNSVLQIELQRARRYERPLSVILLDIDYFKNINDTYGHQVGDLVLIHIAGLLDSRTRRSDILGRWGGEEFMIVCPETDSARAMEVAEKLRTEIAHHDFPAVKSKTASFGVAAYEPGETTDDLVARADAALYRAKNSGRNRVEGAAGCSREE